MFFFAVDHFRVCVRRVFLASCPTPLFRLRDASWASHPPSLPRIPGRYPPKIPFARSTVEGATLGLTKILGGCWAFTYLALVFGNPKFQTMVDPSLLPAVDTPVSAIAISGGGGGGRGRSAGKGAGSRPRAGASVDGSVTGSSIASSTGRAKTADGDAAVAAVPGVIAQGGSSAAAAAAASEGGRRGFGVVRTFHRWVERCGRHRRDSRRRRLARVCGDELERSGGSASVVAPVLVRAGKS